MALQPVTGPSFRHPLFQQGKAVELVSAGIYEHAGHTRWSAAGANVHGFVGDPKAVIVSYSAPTLFAPHTKRSVMAETPFLIPQIGLEGTMSLFYLLNSRRLMGCISVYMGATAGDVNALKLLTSA